MCPLATAPLLHQRPLFAALAPPQSKADTAFQLPPGLQLRGGARGGAVGSGSGARPAGPGHQDPVLEQLLRHVRSTHVRRHFFAHATEEYTEAQDIKVLASTYNVAGRRPPPGQRLHEWLHQWRDSWPKVGSRAAHGADWEEGAPA